MVVGGGWSLVVGRWLNKRRKEGGRGERRGGERGRRKTVEKGKKR